MKIKFLDYFLYSGDLDELVKSILKIIESFDGNNAKYLSCLNPHSVAVATVNPEFKSALLGASFLVPDGIGCVLAAKLFGAKIKRRIAGYEVFEVVSMNLNANRTGQKKRVFFLGSTQETLDKIVKRYAVDYPNIEVVGVISPPFVDKFNEKQNASMLNEINAANADVLWVGLSSPKQDIWMTQNIDKLDVAFSAGIGAVFDFYAENVSRSPLFLQKVGLEWFHRLLTEPRRLWRRTFISIPIFIMELFRFSLGTKKY